MDADSSLDQVFFPDNGSSVSSPRDRRFFDLAEQWSTRQS